MAINNAIGSNIFDILIGLGLPFLLFHLITSGSIDISSKDLDLAFLFLMGSVIILLATFIISRWRTKRLIGYSLIILYLIYLSFEIVHTM